MSALRSPVVRSRFRSPDGKIRLCSAQEGASLTHAVFCKRPTGTGWFLNRVYESREAAQDAISVVDPAWVIDVDYIIVEREPVTLRGE